ncbi:GNAT family N-acetyltransferase [Streptomyces sp. BE147]|uniref:GNAT family N-acetyltransferase n=1 Tax=Streptomyces sp. BE147 TaxID=3002524 RepID=UPI002E784319|nr:GNAT family N-acetyltransferase [Streptomyces sp. BE147]MEE1737050.1 GNAT family N-acetyltransferase [Streptomyces sp. BE147]
MTERAQARLPPAGLSLWKTSYKYDLGNSWTGQRLVALVGGAMAGHLDFFVHPDGGAVSVFLLSVSPGHRKHGFASVLMDALYASYPTAWIDHGTRLEPDGILWWDRYNEPAPERNVHNRPPQEWASYFDARHIFADKAENAARNRTTGARGHRDAEYRYGERTEGEAQEYTRYFREAAAPYADPRAQPLYGGLLTYLPPGLHRFVHDTTLDVSARANALLSHVGHDNLPRAATIEDYTGFWNTTADAALADAAHAEVFQEHRPAQPSTHVVFHALPLDSDDVPTYTASTHHVHYTDASDIPLHLTGLSWRAPARPWDLHSGAFPSPVPASLPPLGWLDATPAYRARYDEPGELRPEATALASQPDSVHASQMGKIRDLTGRLIREVADRSAAQVSPLPVGSPAPQHARQPVPTSGRPPGPRVR